MSTQNSSEDLEKYGKEFKEQSEIIKNCQHEKSLKSCFMCQELFDCQTRKKYVKTLYESMSHGESGGFEF